MALEEWKDFLGNSATVCTIGLFLVGIQLCLVFYKNKTTGESSPMSFLTGVVMTYVWYRYGQLIGDSSLVTVNGTGCVLQSLYLACFYYYSPDKATTSKKIAVVVLILVGVYSYIAMASDVTANIGLLGASMSVAYCGAPLASISHVFKTKSAEVLPFYLILVTAIVMGQWSLYGVIIQDNYVKVPNTLGFFLALLQLSLFCYFPAGPAKKAAVAASRRAAADPEEDEESLFEKVDIDHVKKLMHQ